MALSPADFAAYSRATGTAYPETPEERAQMVPEVRAFRQNQLQAPRQQESNNLALGLGIGLGLAGLGAGALKLRGRGKGQPKADTAGKSRVKMTDLSDQPVPKSKTQVYADVAAKAEEDLPQVTRPSGGVEESMLVTDPETGEIYRRGGDVSIRQKQAQENLDDRVNQLLSDVSVGKAGEMLAGPEVAAETRQMTGTESSRQSAAVRRLEKEEENLAKNILSELAQETSEPQTLVTSQENSLPIVQEQATDALASTDDNVINRVRLDAQRNEDLDLATGTEYPAAGDPFGKSAETAQDVDLIQESRQVSAKAFLENERDEIASQIAEQGLIVTPSRVEKELANRLGTEAYQYGPKYTKRKHALELGATYDPKFFENLNVSSVKIAGQDVPVEPTKQTRVSKTEMLGTPFEEDVQLGLKVPVTGKLGAEMVRGKAEKKLDWLGSVRLEEANKTAADNARLINTNREYNALVDYQTEILNSLDRTDLSPEQRTRGLQTLSDVEIELDRLDARSEELNQRVAGGQGGARVRGAQKHVDEYLENLMPSARLKPGIDEGIRIAYQVDAEGNPLPGTQELVSERRMKDTKAKGGGGRNVAEFTAGTRDEGIEIDMQNILEQLRTPSDQSGREYDLDQFGYRPGTGLTGEALEGKPFTDDRTQTGRVITKTGIQKSGPQPGSMAATVNPFTQLDDETLGMISLLGAEADAVNASRVLARRRREGVDPLTIIGPGQSQRVVVSDAPTESGRRSILMSEAVRKAGYTPYTATGKVRKQEPVRSSTLARTGRIDQEVADFGAEMRGLRRDIQDLDVRGQSARMGPRSRVSGLEPQQRSIPGVTGYGARQRPSEADKAAEQLESYMARLQRGRSTPLTSDVVIQPKLF